MFSYLALGVALMALALLAVRWFLAADPKLLATFLKWLLISVFVAAAGFFVLTGRLAWVFAVLPVLIPMLLRLRTAAMAAKNFARMAQGARPGFASSPPSGQKSDVETRFLRMSLDHDSGAVSGQVLEGNFKGRELDSMALEELLRLLAECLAKDKPSAKVLEAYLDRDHDGWRKQGGPKESHPGGEGNAAMNRGEALQILGLDEKATPEQIKEAHRRLINGLHPDHGGSNYLAAKINQAKDLLLG